MCNHFRWDDPEKILAEAGLIAESVDVRRAEIQSDFWPKRPVPIIYQADKRRLATMRWGVWPFYEKTMPSRLPNDARDDALFTKSIWKGTVAKGRCLVPADTFFEWAGPPKGKWEVMFQLAGKRPFFIAGVWSRDPFGDGSGFAIVTTKPNATLAAVPHERMPAILDPSEAVAWIGDQPAPQEKLLALCRPYPGEMIRTDQPRPQLTPGKVTRSDLAAGLELDFG